MATDLRPDRVVMRRQRRVHANRHLRQPRPPIPVERTPHQSHHLSQSGRQSDCQIDQMFHSLLTCHLITCIALDLTPVMHGLLGILEKHATTAIPETLGIPEIPAT